MLDPHPPAVDFDDSPSGRILSMARRLLLKNKYSGLTMDDLAFSLGMSKKTLYVHFSSKEALVAAIIAATGAAIRQEVGEVMASHRAFPDKLEAVLSIIGAQFGALGPDFLLDLQRHAPALYREIDALKDRNIPLVIGGMLRAGIADGMVRADIDVDFAVEYWLQIIKGVHDPAVLARTGLTPREAFDKGIELFFRSLLTAEGRAQTRWDTEGGKTG